MNRNIKRIGHLILSHSTDCTASKYGLPNFLRTCTWYDRPVVGISSRQVMQLSLQDWIQDSRIAVPGIACNGVDIEPIALTQLGSFKFR